MATIHRAPGDAELLASNLIPIIIYPSLSNCVPRDLKTVIEIAKREERVRVKCNKIFSSPRGEF